MDAQANKSGLRYYLWGVILTLGGFLILAGSWGLFHKEEKTVAVGTNVYERMAEPTQVPSQSLNLPEKMVVINGSGEAALAESAEDLVRQKYSYLVEVSRGEKARVAVYPDGTIQYLV